MIELMIPILLLTIHIVCSVRIIILLMTLGQICVLLPKSVRKNR